MSTVHAVHAVLQAVFGRLRRELVPWTIVIATLLAGLACSVAFAAHASL